MEHGTLAVLDKTELSGEALALAEDVRQGLLVVSSVVAALPEGTGLGRGQARDFEAEEEEGEQHGAREGKVNTVHTIVALSWWFTALEHLPLYAAADPAPVSEGEGEGMLAVQASGGPLSPPRGATRLEGQDQAPLIMDGWRPPAVVLSRKDEKRLSEFQVHEVWGCEMLRKSDHPLLMIILKH